MEHFYEEVKGIWEERFERVYGFWRGFIDDVVDSFLACGDFEGGFARVVCYDCRSEFLVAFSCKSYYTSKEQAEVCLDFAAVRVSGSSYMY